VGGLNLVEDNLLFLKGIPSWCHVATASDWYLLACTACSPTLPWHNGRHISLQLLGVFNPKSHLPRETGVRVYYIFIVKSYTLLLWTTQSLPAKWHLIPSNALAGCTCVTDAHIYIWTDHATVTCVALGRIIFSDAT